MKKRITALFLTFCITFSVYTAFAEGEIFADEGEEKLAEEAKTEEKDADVNTDGAEVQNEEETLTGKVIGIHAEIKNEGYINREVSFAVYKEESAEALSEKSIRLKNSVTSFNMEFEVPEYKMGEEFVIKITKGEAQAEYNGKKGTEFTVQPYIYADEEGKAACQTTFYINLETAAQKKEYKVYLLGKEVPYPYYLSGGEIYMCEDMMKDLRIKCEKKESSWQLLSETGNVTMQFFKDDIYALKNYIGYNLNRPVFEIGGKGYFPLKDIAEQFKCGYRETETDGIIKIETTLSEYRTNPLEDFVNSKNLDSKTDYLIWVSKKDYQVNLFIGKNKYWSLAGSYPCTIGTDYTPTIEGEFEYIEKIKRWDYPDFYCGPVMRFHNGYALHSTLIKYDGTFYDNRVGKKLSHGCIRLRPEDINYLVEYVPLKTKILVTA